MSVSRLTYWLTGTAVALVVCLLPVPAWGAGATGETCHVSITLTDQDGNIPAGSGVYVSGHGLLGNPAELDVPQGSSINYAGRLGPWQGEMRARVIPSQTEIREIAFCRFIIELTSQDETGATSNGAPPDTQVAVEGLGVFDNPTEVLAPIGAVVRYAGRAGRWQGDWLRKLVDCTPVHYPAFCIFTIALTDQNGNIPAGSRINIGGVGLVSNPVVIIAPICIYITYAPVVGPWQGSWARKHVDCTSVRKPAFCVFRIALTDQAGNIPPGSSIVLSGDGVLPNPSVVVAPVGATVVYAARIGGFQGAWRRKLVDCQPVNDPAFCTFHIKLTDQYGDVPPNSQVMVNGIGLLPNPATLTLPVCITIRFAPVLGPWRGGWLSKHVDCTDVTDPNGGPVVAFCKFTIKLTDQNGEVPVSTPTPSQVVVNGLGTLPNPATITAPISCTIYYAARLGPWQGPWRAKHVDCSDVTAREFCTFTIKLVDQYGQVPVATPSPTMVALLGMGVFPNPVTISVPLGCVISYAAVHGPWQGPWRRHTVDCRDVTAREFCTFIIKVLDQNGEIPPDSKIVIQGLGTYDNPLTLSVPLGATVVWAYRWGGWQGPWMRKVVDCSDVVIVGLKRITFKYAWGTVGSPVTLVGGYGPVSSGGSIWAPLNMNLYHAASIGSWQGPWQVRKVTCSWSSVTWTPTPTYQ